MERYVYGAFFVCLFLAACAPNDANYRRALSITSVEVRESITEPKNFPPEGSISPQPVLPRKKIQEGVASWYGPGFHGKPGASGEIYDMYSLTAAHPTLPMGTHVMVTNLSNKKSVEVVISDRGPFLKGRVIDLSYSAAKLLDIVDMGTAIVRIEILDKGPVAERADFNKIEEGYTVQVGSFSNWESALLIQKTLIEEFPDVKIVPYHSPTQTFYRVRVGEFLEKDQAMITANRLASKGYKVLITSLSK